MRRVRILVFTAWAVGAMLAGSVLTSFHQPLSTRELALERRFEMDRPAAWRAVHVLAENCGCSQRVGRHLIARRARADLREDVILIAAGDSATLRRDLESAGFAVQIMAAEQAAGYGVRAAPLMVIVSPSRSVAYRGGYGARGDEDDAIWRELQQRGTARVRPLLGCAFSQGLQRQLDPWGWKYGNGARGK